jgi:hypothetical protein
MEKRIHYTLRIASAMCFIGHGAFGIITKPIWTHYFAFFGVGAATAYQLMPILGTLDILLGISLLAYPMRAFPAWLVCWGIVTALLRPLSGEPFAEFIERAGNFGTPLALLLMAGKGHGIWGWFSPIRPAAPIPAANYRRMFWCLRIATFLLLLGHGWLNVIGKKGFLDQYAALGFSNTSNTALTVGLFEIIAACSLLIRPFAPLLIGLFAWKMASELFYPHYELFEWIERGGSYGALLALWMALPRTAKGSEGAALAT